MSNETYTAASIEGWLAAREKGPKSQSALALVVCWSYAEPHRVGEVLLFPPSRDPYVVGRGPAAEDGEARVELVRQRPGATESTGPLGGTRISRRQLEVRRAGGELEVTAVGRCPMRKNGDVARQTTVRPGDTLMLEGELLLLCAERLSPMSKLRHYSDEQWPSFGGADRQGIVGESPTSWAMRDELAFAATHPGHVLLLGQSGTGKELAAKAVHELSTRGRKRLVSRSAATFPSSLIDAELFGNIKDYPNPGTPERPGLIGEADGATLFLDEIGELPHDLQARLLRVLDSGGEYQRLGEARPRRSDLRLAAATNRDPGDLKSDLLGRFTLQVEVPALSSRREDIPLMVRHILQSLAALGGASAKRLLERAPDGTTSARLDPDLVDALVRHEYSLNVRELQRLLLLALRDAGGKYLALTPAVEEQIVLPTPEPVGPSEVTREDIEAALLRCDGNKTAAAKELGLSSRLVLYRLMKKVGLA